MRTVLIISDCADERTKLADMVRTWGCEPLSAMCASEAVVIASCPTARVSGVLLGRLGRGNHPVTIVRALRREPNLADVPIAQSGDVDSCYPFRQRAA